VRLPGRRSGPLPVSTRGGIRERGSRPAARPIRGGRQAGGGGPLGRVARARGSRRLPPFTPARAAALLGILASLGAGYGLVETPTFTYARAETPDLRWTSRAAVEAALAIPIGTNLVRLSVEPLEARLRALPGVAGATVEVALPDTLSVEIVEREAILGWAVADVRFLVDREGVLFALADPQATDTGGLPLVADTRASAAGLGVGDTLDGVDLDAATRLASLVPTDVGSVAAALRVAVSDANGFTLGTSPASWVAVFGLYTPNLRTPELIPGQVRLLRSLLDGREAVIDQVILADAENGTYIPKPTPGVSP
jgi:hypothetical protein